MIFVQKRGSAIALNIGSGPEGIFPADKPTKQAKENRSQKTYNLKPTKPAKKKKLNYNRNPTKQAKEKGIMKRKTIKQERKINVFDWYMI